MRYVTLGCVALRTSHHATLHDIYSGLTWHASLECMRHERGARSRLREAKEIQYRRNWSATGDGQAERGVARMVESVKED